MINLDQLSTFIEELQRAIDTTDQTIRARAVLSGLEEPPALKDWSSLLQVIDNFEQIAAERAKQDEAFREMDCRRNEIAVEIRHWAQRNPICKTCGAPIEPERLMANGHDHE
jgi:hypothetical protein